MQKDLTSNPPAHGITALLQEPHGLQVAASFYEVPEYEISESKIMRNPFDDLAGFACLKFLNVSSEGFR